MREDNTSKQWVFLFLVHLRGTHLLSLFTLLICFKCWISSKLKMWSIYSLFQLLLLAQYELLYSFLICFSDFTQLLKVLEFKAMFETIKATTARTNRSFSCRIWQFLLKFFWYRLCVLFYYEKYSWDFLLFVIQSICTIIFLFFSVYLDCVFLNSWYIFFEFTVVSDVDISLIFLHFLWWPAVPLAQESNMFSHFKIIKS